MRRKRKKKKGKWILKEVHNLKEKQFYAEERSLLKIKQRTRLLTAQVEDLVKYHPTEVFSPVLSDGFSLFSHSKFLPRYDISRAPNLETDLLWRCDHNCAVNSCSGQILRDRQMLVTRSWKQWRRQQVNYG